MHQGARIGETIGESKGGLATTAVRVMLLFRPTLYGRKNRPEDTAGLSGTGIGMILE